MPRLILWLPNQCLEKRNTFLTIYLLNNAMNIIKLVKPFLNSISDTHYIVGLKTLLQQGISDPAFYGDLV